MTCVETTIMATNLEFGLELNYLSILIACVVVFNVQLSFLTEFFMDCISNSWLTLPIQNHSL